jgi:hypothetical protein
MANDVDAYLKSREQATPRRVGALEVAGVLVERIETRGEPTVFRVTCQPGAVLEYTELVRLVRGISALGDVRGDGPTT